MSKVGRSSKAAACSVAALVTTSAAANTVEDVQLWTTLSASGSIKGDVVGQMDLKSLAFV